MMVGAHVTQQNHQQAEKSENMTLNRVEKASQLTLTISMRAEMRKHRAAPQISRSTGLGVTNKFQ